MRWRQQPAPGERQAAGWEAVWSLVGGCAGAAPCRAAGGGFGRPAAPFAAMPAALPAAHKTTCLTPLPRCRVRNALAAGSAGAAQLAAVAAVASAPALWALFALALTLPWPQAALISAFASKGADLELLQHLHNLLRLLAALLLFDVPQAGAPWVVGQAARAALATRPWAWASTPE